VSSHDRRRRVASPAASLLVGSVVKPAGVGGPVGHGRPGVLELGGAFGLTHQGVGHAGCELLVLRRLVPSGDPAS
jgi:hypothetical protein